jgi:citrate lyase subunit beta / citryl-CoA lyase
MLAKAATLPADEIVIDLEDAVAAEEKDAAREAVAAALRGGDLADRLVAVRVNALGTPWCKRDVQALAQVGPATLVLPKAERPDDVQRLAGMLERTGSRLGVQALIETAAGLQNAGEIAAASPRVRSLILGYADLSASLGRPSAGGEAPASWLFAQETVLVAARAAGVQAIDGPYLRLGDDAGVRAWAAHARALGYDGKWAIHPSQLAPINEAFSPTPEELERARAIVAALDRAEGRGAVELDGQMIDEAHRRLAEAVLARAGASA